MVAESVEVVLEVRHVHEGNVIQIEAVRLSSDARPIIENGPP